MLWTRVEFWNSWKHAECHKLSKDLWPGKLKFLLQWIRTHRYCIPISNVLTKLVALAASSAFASLECQLVVPLIKQDVCRHLDIGREGHKLIDAKVQQEGIDVVSEPFQYGTALLL